MTIPIRSWWDNKRNPFWKKSNEVAIIVYYKKLLKNQTQGKVCEIKLEYESQLYIEDLLAHPNTIHLIKW